MIRWIKSSYSKADGACIELGTDDGPIVLVRNSQHPDRGTLTLPASAVARFVAACKAGDLDSSNDS